MEKLLEDFQYWFGRSRALLESEEISFLGTEAQADLLARIRQAQEAVKADYLLFKATNGQAGCKWK